MMRGRTTMVVALVLSAAPVLRAESPYTVTGGNGAVDRTESHIVTREGRIPAGQQAERASVTYRSVSVYEQRDGAVELVQRRVADASATVGRAVGEQPVYTYEAELLVNHTRVFVDAYRDLMRPTGGIDEDQFLRRGQRMQRQYLSRLRAKPAHVIHGSPDQPQTHTSITPSAVIEIPDSLKRGPKKKDPQPIPSVPAPPKRDRIPSLASSN